MKEPLMNLLSHTDPVFFLNADKDSPLWGTQQDILVWLEKWHEDNCPTRAGMERREQAESRIKEHNRKAVLRSKARQMREILDK